MLARFISDPELGVELRMHRFFRISKEKENKEEHTNFSLRAYFLLASSMPLTKKTDLQYQRYLALKKIKYLIILFKNFLLGRRKAYGVCYSQKRRREEAGKSKTITA